MVNWKDIHPDFNSTSQVLWEEHDFYYEETKCWINIGLSIDEVGINYLFTTEGLHPSNY